MSISVSARVGGAVVPAKSLPITSRVAIPVYIYAVSLAALLTVVGVLWDISWHRSIGRDRFLTPPHILIYLGALFAGLFSGVQVLYTSFFRRETSRAGSIRFWGIFYGSLGNLFCIWGAIAMLTSAPFDDWWHNAYGLDVKILSPPHTLLAMGMIFLQLGACVSICKYLNTDLFAGASSRVGVLRALFVVSAASLLTMVYLLGSEYMQIHNMRGGGYYILCTVATLLFLPAFGQAVRMRWGMTAIAGGYFVLVAVSGWILEAFPAEPKLGPILTHITHFQPEHFPALVFIPALAMDLVMQHAAVGDWRRAFLLGLVFVCLLLAVQYPFSGFLLESPYARNWFFRADTWYYGASPDAMYRYRFAPGNVASLPVMGRSLAIAVLSGWLCARLALRWGKWMQNIQR